MQTDYLYIGTVPELRKALAPYWNSKGVCAFDTETTGLEANTHKLRLLQIYFGKGPVLVIDAEKIPAAVLTKAMRPFLEGSEWLVILQNAKFDWQFVKVGLGLKMKRAYDTMLVENLLTAGLYDDCGLDDIVERYHDGLVLDKSLQKSFINGEAMTDAQHEYAAADVALLHTIMYKQVARLREQDMLRVAQLEFDVMPILAEVECVGVRLDAVHWAAHTAVLADEAAMRRTALVELLQPLVDAWRAEEYAGDLAAYGGALAEWECLLGLWEAEQDAIKAVIAAALPWPVPPVPMKGKQLKAWEAENAAPIMAIKLARNLFWQEWRAAHPRPAKPSKPKCDTGEMKPGSNPQLGAALTRAGVPLKLNEKNNWDTSKEALSLLEDEFDVVAAVMEYRRYQKLVEAFGPIIEKLDAVGRLHTKFRQILVTGRMACSNPNLQQIPKNELGAEFRKCFIASDGWRMVGADYSQMELRILAELADEPNMKQVFEADGDLHTAMAAKMFGIPESEVNKTQRFAAKSINFGIAYGLSKWGLARALRISVDEAEAFINAYFAANAQVKRWLDRTARSTRVRGYSETPLGRRRYFRNLGACPDRNTDRPGYYAWLGKARSQERAGCNHPIQGGNADVTKYALVYLDEAIQARGAAWRILLVVHDEIVIEAPEAEAEEAKAVLVECMVRAGQLVLKTVPCKVEAAVAAYWEH